MRSILIILAITCCPLLIVASSQDKNMYSNKKVPESPLIDFLAPKLGLTKENWDKIPQSVCSDAECSKDNQIKCFRGFPEKNTSKTSCQSNQRNRFYSYVAPRTPTMSENGIPGQKEISKENEQLKKTLAANKNAGTVSDAALASSNGSGANSSNSSFSNSSISQALPGNNSINNPQNVEGAASTLQQTPQSTALQSVNNTSSINLGQQPESNGLLTMAAASGSQIVQETTTTKQTMQDQTICVNGVCTTRSSQSSSSFSSGSDAEKIVASNLQDAGKQYAARLKSIFLSNKLNEGTPEYESRKNAVAVFVNSLRFIKSIDNVDIKQSKFYGLGKDADLYKASIASFFPIAASEEIIKMCKNWDQYKKAEDFNLFVDGFLSEIQK